MKSANNLLHGRQTKSNQAMSSRESKLSPIEVKILILVSGHTLEQITEANNF